MEIFIEVKTVYGIDKIYPACDKSKLLAKLAGTVTITEDNLKIIKELGYKITIKHKQHNF